MASKQSAFLISLYLLSSTLSIACSARDTAPATGSQVARQELGVPVLANPSGSMATRLARTPGREHPKRSLAVATALFHRDDSSAALRLAIASAVARGADPAAAIDFLWGASLEHLRLGIPWLAARVGGPEAMHDKYQSERRATCAAALRRALLVSGLQALDATLLLSIASSDRVEAVRAAAWKSMLAAAEFRPSRAALQVLGEQHANLGHPERGLSDEHLVAIVAAYLRRASEEQSLCLGQAMALVQRIADDSCLGAEAHAKARSLLQQLYSGAGWNNAPP